MSSPPNSRATLVKLNGSLIARGARRATVRHKVLSRLASELHGSPGPLILIHGAGAFAGPPAHRFGLGDAPTATRAPAVRVRGAAIASAEAGRVHASAVSALLEAGGRPWSVPPALLCRQAAGRIEHFDAEPFLQAITRGFTPVSFGDVVADSVWGSSVFPTNALALELARRKIVRRVLFVSDLPGITDSYAPDGAAVSPQPFRGGAGGSGVADPRGSAVVARGTAETLLALGELQVDAGVISGLSDGRLSRALRGEPVYGSWSTARDREAF